MGFQQVQHHFHTFPGPEASSPHGAGTQSLVLDWEWEMAPHCWVADLLIGANLLNPAALWLPKFTTQQPGHSHPITLPGGLDTLVQVHGV